MSDQIVDALPTPSVAQQLLNAYLADQLNNQYINDMAKILTSNLNTDFHIQSFIELRSQYIGNINHNNNNDDNNNNDNVNTTINISNNTTTCKPIILNDDIIFNIRLFHATLLTNSPAMIDQVLTFTNIDFTKLNIPHDQLDMIKQCNFINTVFRYGDEVYHNNYILIAIVGAIEKGCNESIQHLIQQYDLSPTISICDVQLFRHYQCTNFLYYATSSPSTSPSSGNHLQLIEYLLPLCIPTTNKKVLVEIIQNILKHGYLHLIQQLKDEYKINFIELQTTYDTNFLHAACESNNIELIDYVINTIGCELDDHILSLALHSKQYNVVKHLLNHHQVDPSTVEEAVWFIGQDATITPDSIDYLITTFNITEDDINNPSEPVLFSLAANNNLIAIQHLVNNHNADPCCINETEETNILHHVLFYSQERPTLELLEYIYSLGIDINQGDIGGNTPIDLAMNHTFPTGTPIKCQKYIIQSLIEHKAYISNINGFITSGLQNKYYSILQYLFESYEPKIDITKVREMYTQSPLLPYAVGGKQSIQFIQYILSLNQLDVNDTRGHNTPIASVMTGYNLNLDVIQLLITHGAKVPIQDWLSMFYVPDFDYNPYILFNCIDYFKTKFNWDIETFTMGNDYHTTPLIQFTSHINSRYNKLQSEQLTFRKFVIYRTLLHRYKANINDQHKYTKVTPLHNLAQNNQLELLHYTILNSYHKPNLHLVNSKRQTFFHVLVMNLNHTFIGRNRRYMQSNVLKRIDNMEFERDDDKNKDLIIPDDDVLYYIEFENFIIDMVQYL